MNTYRLIEMGYYVNNTNNRRNSILIIIIVTNKHKKETYNILGHHMGNITPGKGWQGENPHCKYKQTRHIEFKYITIITYKRQ